MHKVSRSALILHSADKMYRLVEDVESYPQFLPWCEGAQVLKRAGDEIEARVDVGLGPLRHSFTTRNRLTPGQELQIALVDGPFSTLQGYWTFRALQEDACKVELELEFEFSNALLEATFSGVFNKAMQTMMDAFCKRADEVYP
ncbi:type II toxin-antitoxin system RatA family toxin [Aestuariirhabdus litorea]|uniref:Type II toxin-antitoxin system RatA family toxin n=1 Tax=Aestuariirhabdus litorea TaxID=2528527 RepID=A0A3P3VR79_9GAMM|nr:type II toxin-antitoxin system RatA family toxin [Aestuariirhabdus litorea]RRJ83333.1 type II toxin-antitoxin system RatA family toxin [Aestuariirhabdus litorea]RWW93492.1 type II toxin-antitoxin system RatA family toxin [Endozoicomonadaceae bacterium GTF-13]